jgi:hypothetical protein
MAGSMKFVKFSQMNGIVCYGEALAKIMWDGTPATLIRYWARSDEEPPRRPYILVETERLSPLDSLPDKFKPVSW